MPKIIEDARQRILDSARALLFSVGYKDLTMRKVAKQCGIASGTIYNYFPNKEMLAASIMAEDWMDTLAGMRRGCDSAPDVTGGVRAVHDAIAAYAEKYEPIWAQYGGMPSGFGERHLLLRGQITAVLDRLLERFSLAHDPDFTSLLAETVLACAIQKDIPFCALNRLIAIIY